MNNKIKTYTIENDDGEVKQLQCTWDLKLNHHYTFDGVEGTWTVKFIDE